MPVYNIHRSGLFIAVLVECMQAQANKKDFQILPAEDSVETNPNPMPALFDVLGTWSGEGQGGETWFLAPTWEGLNVKFTSPNNPFF